MLRFNRVQRCLRFVLLGCSVASLLSASLPAQEPTDDGAKRSSPWNFGRTVDLTHSLDAAAIYWPGAENFALEKVFAGVTDRGYYYTANNLRMAEHGGTHIDAPIHFYKNRQTVDQIPLERLMGEAVLVDVSQKCAADPDYQIGVADLRDWEKKHGRQLVDVIVLLRTGYAAHWPNRDKYLGTEKTGADAAKDLHFPGLDPEAAKWLVEQRAIKAIGIDTASIDHGQSRLFGSHVMLFKHNVPALENVKLNADLPAEGFGLIALPIKTAGGSGGPTRIVALLKE